jgi:hypothetical protein
MKEENILNENPENVLDLNSFLENYMRKKGT